MGETTIGDSSPETKQDIKDLANEEIVSETGVSIAAQTEMDTVSGDLDTAEADIVTNAAAAEVNAGAIAVLQAQVNDPIVGTEFILTVADNTLAAVVTAVTSPTFESWQIVINSDTEPVGGFTTGTTIPAAYTLPDWLAYTYYLWVEETIGGTITQIPPSSAQSDGLTVPGLVFQATQTQVAPSEITDLAVTRTIGSESTSFDISFSSATAGTSAIDGYSLIDPNNQINFLSSITPDITTTYAGLPSDTSFVFQVIVTDENGLTNTSNIVAVRTAIAAAGVIGIQAVTVRADSTGGYEHTEDTTPITITLERTGGTTGAISVLIRQIDGTALDGTNYTKTVENGTANEVSWGDGVSADQDVDVVLTDVNMATNLAFQFEIIKDSEAGGCTVDVNAYDWGRGNSVLCYVNGSASPEEGYIQEATGDNILCLPVEDTVNNTFIPDTARAEDYFTVFDNGSPPNGSTESGKAVKPESWLTDVSTPTTVASTAARITIPAVFTQTGDHYCWARVFHPSDGASDQFHAAVGVANDSTNNELYNIWADNTSNNGVNPRWKWVNINRASGVLLKNISAAGVTTVELYRFEGRGEWDKILFTTNPDYDPTGIGAAAWRDDPETPSIDDNLGPTWSAWSDGGAIVDDLGNLTYPNVPAITALVPDILIPSDGTSNIDVQRTEFRAIFTGAANIQGASIVIQNNTTKATIAGVTSVEGDNFNEILFTASQNFDSDSTYDIFTWAQSVTDSVGVERFIALFSVGDWQFSTVNTVSDFVFRETWDSFVAPHLITGVDNYNTDLHDIWNIKTWSAPGGDEYGIQGVFEGYLKVIDDPDGSVARGNVLQVKYPGNKQGNYASMTVYPRFNNNCTTIPSPSLNTLGGATDVAPGSTDPKWTFTGGPPDLAAFAAREVRRGNGTEEAYDELYMAYDIRLDDNWYYNFASKIPGMTTGTNLQSQHTSVAVSDGIYAEGGTWMQFYHTVAWGNPEGALSFYLYDALRVQLTLFLYRDGILPGNSRSDYYSSTINADWNRAYVLPRGTWVTIEIRQKMNTAPSVLDAGWLANSTPEGDDDFRPVYANTEAVADGCLEDGIVEVWITDPRPVSLDPFEGGTGGIPVKMLSVTNIMWRFHEAFKIDKLRLMCYTNAPRPDRPNNLTDQYLCMDNFRNSTDPITHT